MRNAARVLLALVCPALLPACLVLADLGESPTIVDAEDGPDDGRTDPVDEVVDEVGDGDGWDTYDADGSGVSSPNGCGGRGALQFDGEDAVPGSPCGVQEEGFLVCNGPDALRCVGAAASNACGGVGELPVALGTPCGCGGEVVCAEDGGVVCAGGTQTNMCGGCSTLTGRPGFVCDADGTEGRFVCVSTDELTCVAGDGNACGGDDALLVDGEATPGAAPGGACVTEACGPGRYECDSEDELVCVANRPCNSCGGLNSLAGTPGDTCGACGDGTWACDGANRVSCEEAATPNACGGCQPLAAGPGATCTPRAGQSGVVLCRDSGTVCSPVDGPTTDGGTGTRTLNACGGDSVLRVPAGLPGAGETATLGARCGACDGGELVCDGAERVRCTVSNAAQLNVCGGCTDLFSTLNAPCGTCGTGVTACDGAEALQCEGDRGPTGGTNVCGGCGALPGTVGGECGTCLVWACTGTRLECAPTSVGAECGGVTRCADLACASQNRACEETDGTTDAVCADCVAGYTEQAGGLCAPVDCGSLTSPANGSLVTPAGTTFGGTATYSCSAGYSLVGETTRTCQASGVWSGSAPTCAPVDCGGLPNPGNGTVATPAGTEFGATATYSCSSGFTLVGTDTRTCEASGRWSGAAPTCSEVDCGSLAAPGNGTVNTPSGTGRGATATYACTSGYTLSGAATRTCGDTGTWTGTAPTCTAVDCGVLTNPTNGAVQTASGTAFGASATYSCSAGYSLVGEAGRTCLATGLWSGVAATCSPVDCGTPPTVTNGSRTFTTTVYQSTANYSCATGFVRAGAASITCQATGAWSTPPACNDINECTVGGVCTGVANTCTNTAGSWSCGCSAGYTGSAVAAGNAVCVGVLGSACSADNNCPAGSWCPTSTLPELRRCSPRVFGGQAHQMDFMFVPAGTFEQGTTGATGEERPYTATITRNYFVSRTEVTQGQWRAASGAVNPSCFQSTTGTSCTTSNANNSGPVEQVDWWSAVRYANWLSSQNGLSECYALSGCSESSSTGWYDGDHDTECTDATFVGQSCTGYRLLTEAEWERAARGGTTSTYYWGESTETATMGQYGWYNFNSDSRTQSVGLKLANAYGLVDISGNVLEWVWDLYASAYPSGSSTNYVGASSGSVRVLRGGSFGFGASNARTAYRGDFGPSNRFSDDGFRLARTVPTVSGLSCPVLDVPANGRLAVSSFFAGATAVYGCDAAYAVEGAATRTCQSDGTWSGVAPSCVRIPSLGQVCTTDTQCESNEWCPTNTLSELRRCSPRLFGGQAHQMDFMFVPAGTFEQGTPGATDDERPYTATITRNYFVSRTEVTQGQWRAASDSVNPSCFQSTTGTSCTTTNANNTGPVENVDWWSAVAYANWLSSQNGLPTCYTLSGCSENSSTGWYDGDFDTGCTAATFVGQSCTGYRLLTESEWERAARGGTTTTHYWGESTDLATMGQYAWYALNSGARSQTVGQKLANPYGLVDMIGNVAEWVWDRYSDSYPSGTATDYVGPSSGTSRLDSGSTYFDDARARAAARGYNSPSNRYLARGFRVARTVPVVSGVSCPALNVPANGRLAVSSFFPGATAAYVCDPAYVVEGTATRTCQSDGTWSGVAPTCLPLLSLGQACLADTQCGTNGWCPTGTLPELRRCSPRLFGGQAHQMDFMFVPAGTFEQGSPGTTGEERPYTSTISRNYFVSRTEVTQGQWRAASGTTNPSCFQSTTGTSCTTSNANNTGPVENIDWWSAVRYANWLSTQNSLTACYTLTGCTESSSTGWYDGDHDAGCTGATFVGQSCTGYRLLTESEWERAARGGTTSTYYWGESTVAATVGQYAWYTSNSGGRTQLVGQKGANAYGLVDTSGSVAEWVWDWVYSGSAWLRYPSLDATDYLGGVTGSFRGLRGGSWPYSASDLRSANRFGVSNPAGRDSNLGLRLARTVP